MTLKREKRRASRRVRGHIHMEGQECLGHQRRWVAERGLDKMSGVARREPTAKTPWETEKKKSSEFTRRDFEDKGCGRTKSLCPVQVPLPKEQGWFCSLCCRIKMKMFGKYFGYI